MKILETQSASLSNAEVLSHLNNLSERRQRNKASHLVAPPLKAPNYEAVIKELTEYLQTPPLSAALLPPKSTVRNLIVRLKDYNLAKGELLMILNLKPQDLGFLDCVLEECDLRFTQEQQEDMLMIIEEYMNSGVSNGGKADQKNGQGDVEEEENRERMTPPPEGSDPVMMEQD